MSFLSHAETRFIVQIHIRPSDRTTSVHPPLVAHNIVGRVLPQISAAGTDSHTSFSAVPAFDTVRDAIAETKANASIVLASTEFVADAVTEAADAGIELVVVLGGDLPCADRDRLNERLSGSRTVVLGPTGAELIVPGICHLGSMPSHLCTQGDVGVVSDSNVLAAQAALQTSALGLGQSAIISVGTGVAQGTTLASCVGRLLADHTTKAVALLLENVSKIEDSLIDVLAARRQGKPVVAHIDDLPRDSFVNGRIDSNVVSFMAAALPPKVQVLRGLGVTIVDRPVGVGTEIKAALERPYAKPIDPAPRDFASAMRRVEADIYQAI